MPTHIDTVHAESLRGLGVAVCRRFFGWLNQRLNIIETDPIRNAWYDWADQRLDEIEQVRSHAPSS